MNTIQSFFYDMLYWFSYIEIFYKKYFVPLMKGKCCDLEIIMLIHNASGKAQILYDYTELNSEAIVEFEYDFGIVEKQIDDKTCQFIFDDLDTDDIPKIFQNRIERPFFSCDIHLNDTNEDINIDISNIDYFFDGNTIFFKNHLHYILQKHHGIILDDRAYSLSLIDHECNPVILTEEQYVYLDLSVPKRYIVSIYEPEGILDSNSDE